VSQLIFAGLFTYNKHNKLVGDLAKSYSVDSTGKVYTIHLRKGLTWQDGQPLTSADVVFTYKVIQNPDANSPLWGSWSGIGVTANDRYTVTFTLPNPLSSFIYGATNGIIPEHLLKDVPMVGMRSIAFNTQAPIGAGPFLWRDIDVTGDNPSNAEESIGLAPFKDYWRGEPKLKSFTVHSFASQDAMIKAYNRNQLTAMSGLTTLPASVKTKDAVQHSFLLTAETMVFFKTSAGVLKDPAVRQALVAGSNPNQVLERLGYSTRPVTEPLLMGQLGYDRQYEQKTGDRKAAATLLNNAGWVPDSKTGLRSKGADRLEFTLTINDTPEYRKVAKGLQAQWRELGINMHIETLDDASFHTVIGKHTYDAVLYGISIGADPDVYVYWDSSQNDARSTNHLNLSEYSSPVANEGLEAGRTRTEPALRTIKYSSFLKQWQQDAPALGLYQPRYLYVSHVPVYDLEATALNSPTDRFNNVSNWMIRTARTTDK
jgi:peptide/nickel transport system substrate-binding protein